MLLFDLDREDAFGGAMAAALRVTLAPHEERVFDDGERKLRAELDPYGADAYVVASLHGEPGASPHDKLVRLLMFIATLRDHGAARVSAVVRYLAYARKDRHTKPFDPLGLRYVAQLFEAVGTDQLFAFEVHNPAAFDNAFRCTTIRLDAHDAFMAWVARRVTDDAAPLAIASPDPGGVKRAQLWHEAAQAQLGRPLGFAFCDKRRSGGVLSSRQLVAGDVRGATVLLVDDLIVSGSTLQGAALALRGAGSTRIVACAAHALFDARATAALGDPAIDAIVVSDSVPLPPAAVALRAKLEVVSCVPLIADALRRSREGWRREPPGH